LPTNKSGDTIKTIVVLGGLQQGSGDGVGGHRRPHLAGAVVVDLEYLRASLETQGAREEV